MAHSHTFWHGAARSAAAAAILSSSLAVLAFGATSVAGPVPAASAAASTIRLAGSDRVGTAVAISQASFGHFGAGAAVLSRSDLFPDALAGTPLARRVGGPLLLTDPASLDPRVQLELARVLAPGNNVFLLGTTDALSANVETQVIAAGYHVVRLGGADRFGTARVIAQYITSNFGLARIFEATGLNFPDALSGGPPAAIWGGVILLTADDAMVPDTAAFIVAHPTVPRFALGDQAVAADSALAPPPGGTVALAGLDRFATSAAVATRFFSPPTGPSPISVGAATAFNFPDALAGGADMARRLGPMLLVPASGSLPSAIDSYLHGRTSIHTIVAYGSSAVVGSDVVNAMVSTIG